LLRFSAGSAHSGGCTAHRGRCERVTGLCVRAPARLGGGPASALAASDLDEEAAQGKEAEDGPMREGETQEERKRK
jgi:hypothetical protein